MATNTAAFANGDTVLVLVDGVEVEGVVVRAYKTKVRVQTEDEVVSAAIEHVFHVEHDEDDEGGSRMSKILQKYREKYVVSVSSSGRKSLHNGDELAKLLEYKDGDAVVRAAEKVLGFKKGELAALYEGKNNGQKRMCSGNRIRAALRRGEISIDEIAKAI